jgi:hypothetical protein
MRRAPPVKLIIAAATFIAIGIWWALEFVLLAIHGRYDFDLRLFAPIIGVGLWRGHRSWRTVGLVVAVLLAVFALEGSILVTLTALGVIAEPTVRIGSFESSFRVSDSIVINTLVVIATGVLASFWIWCLTRKHVRWYFSPPPNLCPNCGYPKRGVRGTTCPECGIDWQTTHARQ